ncbi:hypothetical protein BC832DRAFT_448432 [Gaertneriomyces semiglobifer]|nr:hypothetical protein BC832DRAFT_448432 [Gaertneriomyces semiglobifer]
MSQAISTLQRTLRAHWEDMKRHRAQWQGLVDDGFGVAQKVVNLVLEQKYAQPGMETTLGPVIPHFFGLTDRFEERITEEISPLRDELDTIVKKLMKLHVKMTGAQQHLLSLLDEIANDWGEDTVYRLPVFRTRTFEGFCCLSQRLVDLYSRELALKQRIVDCLTPDELSTRARAMLYLSAWLQQPYMDEHVLDEVCGLWDVEVNSQEAP